MIVYVDLEQKRLQQHRDLWRFFATKTLETKYRLEAISGQPCLIVHYERCTPTLLWEVHPGAVVVGGHYFGLHRYSQAELEGLRACFKEAAWPTMTICGSFQLMAQVYGAEIGPVESLPSDSPDSLPDTPVPSDLVEAHSTPGEAERRQERDFVPVRVLHSHPLFEGLGPQPVVYQLHSWEVKSVPDQFEILAESDLSKVQAIAHKEAPLFGTQFHVEQYDAAHPAGRQILENFFKFAGVAD